MFFPESEVIANEHLDLLTVVEKVDERLSLISAPAVLRPMEFAATLGAELHQVSAVLGLLEERGVLISETMMHCAHCDNLLPEVVHRHAIDEDDECQCTMCRHVMPPETPQMPVYRLTDRARSLPRPSAPVGRSLDSKREASVSADTVPSRCGAAEPDPQPLPERAQNVLIAMVELGAVDPDKLATAETIARKALGPRAFANHVKYVMQSLKRDQLVMGKSGPGGGHWLTAEGLKRAEKLSQI